MTIQVLAEEGQNHCQIAQALVAKEMARIVHHVLRDDVDFNGTFKGVPIENPKPAVWPRRASPDA